jgi:hypothetical protein
VGELDPLARQRHVGRHDLGARGAAAVEKGGHGRRAGTHVRIEDQVARIGEGQHEALDQLDGELAGVGGLLDVVVLDVGDRPHVARVLAERVARRVAGVGTLEVALARVLLRHAHRVQVEHVALAREPEDGLVPAREAAAAVEAMLEMPDDAVAEAEPVAREVRVEEHVEREDLARVDVVPHLPADAAVVGQHAHALGDDARLPAR